LSKIHDVPIALVCGRLDMLSSPEDYLWLKEEFLRSKTLVYFKEFELGHLGILMPKERTHFYEMLELMKSYHPGFQQPNPTHLDFALQ
jgi:hypothetical protein